MKALKKNDGVSPVIAVILMVAITVVLAGVVFLWAQSFTDDAEGDVETVMASFTEDIQWNEAENFIYADGNPYVGGSAVAEGVFTRLGSEWEYWNLDNIQFYNVDTNMVLVTGRYKALNKASGKELDAQFAHLWTLKDSLASSFQQYTDTKQAAEAIVVDEE